MIQVSNLSKAYGTQVIFDAISFSVNARERVGLVGRNGHGKTTLFRMITGEERPDSGSISIPSGYTTGYLSQHLNFREETVLAEGNLALNPAEDGRDESYKVEAVLLGLGFSQADFPLHPLDLSGGFQVRLHLAKLLVSEPNLLLLDEPTNYLDIVSIRWLAKFLRAWQGELMIITHDRAFMDSVTTHTLGIHRQRIWKIAGPTDKLYQQILLEEEVYERTRTTEERKRKEMERFINRFRAQATRARAVQSRIKALARKERLAKKGEIRDLEFEFVPAAFTGKSLLEAKNVSFSFQGEGEPLIKDFSLSIGKRDRIAVVGKNGKGKTTLLNLLAGEIEPHSGDVIPHQQLKLAYFGQTNIQRLSPERTVEEEILSAYPDNSRTAVRTICGIMMFEGENALKKIQVLSGGEKSRVLLGRLIVSPANLLVLDEPTNHLDMASVDSLVEAISAFPGAVVIVTHSEMILHAVAERLVVFDDEGLRVFEGPYADFLARDGWRDNTDAAVTVCQQKAEGLSRKDLKRIKAELVNSRSRTLGPLQSQITAVEEKIMRLEKESEEDTKALLEASVKGAGESIRNLSKSLHEKKERIDTLFRELETLTHELEAKTREFEVKFSEFESCG